MHVRSTAPAPASMAALVVLENVVVDAVMRTAFVFFITLLTCASWASLISVAIFPSFNKLHLLEEQPLEEDEEGECIEG